MTYRRRSGAALAALLYGIAALAGDAKAYTYLESAYGTPMIGLSARAIAMGGAVTAMSDGSFSLVSNPAMLSGEADRLADLTLRGIRYDETRFVPLFDTFDSFVKETAIAENPETYTGINGGIVWRPEKGPKGLAVAGGIFERYNLQYDFVDERRFADGRDTARRDLVRATQYITSERAIYSMSGGLSYQERVLSIGASLHYLFGDLTLANTTVPGPVAQGAADAASRTELVRELSGIGATFGASARISNRVTVGASYDLPVKFDVDYRMTTTNTTVTTATGSEKMDYPGRLAVGVSYQPRNILKTTFTMDVARTFWEDLEDPILDAHPMVTIPTLRNTYEYRFGLEHVFYNGLPARIGFFYREAYAVDEVDDAGISFGTGYRFSNFDFGISADVSKRNSSQAAITARAANDPKTDRVQDSMLRGVVDVRYHF